VAGKAGATVSEFESQASKVRRLLPLLDVRDLWVVLDDVAALVRQSHPAVSSSVRIAAILARVSMPVEVGAEKSSAEHSPSCSDVEPGP